MAVAVVKKNKKKFKREVLVEWRELERDKNNNNNNKRDEFRWKNNMDIL